jgi:hypothetical protein
MSSPVCRVVVALLAAAFLALPLPAMADQATVGRELVEGFASARFGDCDFDAPPVGPTLCHETFVLAFLGANSADDPSMATPNVPAGLYVDQTTFIITGHANGDFEIVVLTDEHGFSSDISFVNDSRLLSASVRGQVTLGDGLPVPVDVDWTSWSDLLVFGSDSPSLGVDPQHVVNRCLTFTANGQQTNRFATATGTIGGVAVTSYQSTPWGAVIGRGHYVYVTATHGSC